MSITQDAMRGRVLSSGPAVGMAGEEAGGMAGEEASGMAEEEDRSIAAVMKVRMSIYFVFLVYAAFHGSSSCLINFSFALKLQLCVFIAT